MIKCEVVEKVSNKTGNRYCAVEVTLPNGYKTMLFFKNQAEMFMVQSFLNEK